jgi:GT2 family glycosyltransferase
MIPTYRPQEAFLRKTLESVLQQAAGADTMQIEVVDDGSPDGNTEAMVRAIAGNRVQFSRTPKNLGLAGCWNTCIERARGQWVHLLHHDDYVLPGFYGQLRRVAEQHPEVALVACRSFLVDGQGVIGQVSPRLPELEPGSRAVEAFFYANPLQCPGVVMRRTFYEMQGGFRPDLFYVLDLEMWARAVGLAGGVVLPDVLACFRSAQGQTTSRLERSGESLRDVARLIQIYAERYPAFDRRRSLRQLCEKTLDQARRFSKAGDAEAAKANWHFWNHNLPVAMRFPVFVSRLAQTFARRLSSN